MTQIREVERGEASCFATILSAAKYITEQRFEEELHRIIPETLEVELILSIGDAAGVFQIDADLGELRDRVYCHPYPDILRLTREEILLLMAALRLIYQTGQQVLTERIQEKRELYRAKRMAGRRTLHKEDGFGNRILPT